MRKIIRSLLIGIMLVLTAIGIAACSGEQEYTITVESTSGVGVPGITVRLLKDGELQGAEFTDGNGTVTFTLPADEYTIELGNLPVGYRMNGTYTTDTAGTPVTVELVSTVIEGEAPDGHIYSLGSVMYDFTYTEVETGETKSLIELLETKRAVLLNFWYIGCTWCEVEFPLMQEAYEEYQDKLAIVAINPGTNSESACANYKLTTGLTFDVTIDAEMNARFQVTGYPTSVMIDRYGVVCEIEAGGITDVNIFRQLFEQYTDEDYEQDIGGAGELEVPDVEAPDLGEFAGALNDPETASDFEYRFDENEYNWPWLISGDGYVYNSNSSEDGSPKNSSFAIFYLDATLEEDEVLAFEYMTDSEADGDIFYFFVDGEIVGEFSGSNDWTKYYAYLGDGEEHEFAFAYVKDATRAVGEDTVGLRNMRITDVGEIESEGGYLEILRQAATGYDASDPDNPVYTEYADIYLADDGFYHVGTKEDGAAANGDPYLLAEINEDTLWGPAIYPTLVDILSRVCDAKGNPISSLVEQLDEEDRFLYDRSDLITEYAWLGRFSDIMYTPVTEELRDLLIEIVGMLGNDNPNDNETEWLEICRYLEQFGNYEPMINPILGLTNDFAIDMLFSTDGVNNANHVTINKIFVPRGMRYRFVPEETGTYIFYSVGNHNAGGNETMAWLFDSEGNMLAEHAGGEGRPSVAVNGNFEIVADLIAGEEYYLACAYFSVGYFGEYDFYCQRYEGDYVISPIASPTWTTDGEVNEDGTTTGEIILPLYVDGVEYFADEDTWYVVNANGEPVAPVMVDFESATSFSPHPLTWFIEQGLFDFSGNGFYSYEKYQAIYDEIPEEDRLDYTSVMKKYANPRGPFMNAQGYVVANQEIVEILRILMRMEDRFTPDISWLQLCYYARPTT